MSCEKQCLNLFVIDVSSVVVKGGTMGYWLVRWTWDKETWVPVLCSWARPHCGETQYFRFSPPVTSYEFEEKTCKTFVEKCYKFSTGRED